MEIAMLMDANGRQIKQPTPVTGSISWDLASGKAFLWAADSKTLLSELVGARVVWINASGIRLEGLEPIDLNGTRFRAQSWQVIF